MDKIRNEQHLLELFYQADRICINERSGEIVVDTKKLNDLVIEYAERRNLDDSFVDTEAGIQF